jgi:hypothetical protein
MRAYKEEYAWAFVMAGLVPAIPMLKSTAFQAIEITGTRPVMTSGGLPVLYEPASQDEGRGGKARLSKASLKPP